MNVLACVIPGCSYHFVIAVWRAKEAESARVKYWKTTLAILAALSASLALADDFKTIDGKEYKNATVSRVEADGIMLKFHGGISKIYFVELPQEVQKQYGYDPKAARNFQQQQPGNIRHRRFAADHS